MDNEEIISLINQGYSLIEDLEYFPHKEESSIVLTDKINFWADDSMRILKKVGKDKDEIKVVSIINPISNLFDFEKLENKKSLEKNKLKIKDFIVLILNDLVKNKGLHIRENTIFYNKREIYINQKGKIKYYRPRRIKNKDSKRMCVILLLIKRNKLLSPKEIADRIDYTDGSEVKKEIEGINEMTREKLDVKYDLIIHHKNLGYNINKSRYRFIESKK
ncbi:MAG TPA: hypothetical protein PKL13_03975 [bacterium]|nr:hypothetical protein [bacterium]